MDSPRRDGGKQRQLSAEGTQRRSWHQPRDVEPLRRAGHTSPTETDFLIQRQVTPPQEDNEEQLSCGRQLVQFFLDTCRRCLPSSGDEANSPASGLDVAPSTSLPGVVISAAGDTLSTIPTEAVEDEDISLNPDNQSPMKGMTGVHAGKDIPGPSTTKGKAKQEVTYIRYEVKDTQFAAMTPRLPEKRVPTEEQENSSLEAQGFTIMRGEVEEVAPKVIVRADFPTSNYNCHGWTFLEGEAWLDDDKDVINELLRVGEFEPISISDTKPGDIALYRNVITGKVTHSAPVYEIRDGNKLVCASKWAEGGLFYHYSDDVPKEYYNEEVDIEIYRAPEAWTYPSPKTQKTHIRRSTSEDVIARIHGND